MTYESTRVEKWAVFLRVYRGVIVREAGDANTLVTDHVVLTHYRLRRQAEQRLQLGDQINQLFSGTGVGETDHVNAVESILGHAIDTPALQAEAIANTPIDFASSATIHVELDELPYAAGNGHQEAIETSAVIQSKLLDQLAISVVLGSSPGAPACGFVEYPPYPRGHVRKTLHLRT